MNVDLLYRPSYSVARVRLDPGELIRAESGAMVGMTNVEMSTGTRGGLLKSLARSVLGGESFFINTFTASAQGGEVLLAPALPGDVVTYPMQGDPIMVQSGSYLASSDGIEVDTKWGGAKTFFASEGLIMLKCSGRGNLLLSSYGAIHEVELSAGTSYTVDTGHLVAFGEKMGFKVRTIGGVKATVFGGEGLVVDLHGPGKVLLQTRSEGSFLAWLLPKLPKPSSSSR